MSIKTSVQVVKSCLYRLRKRLSAKRRKITAPLIRQEFLKEFLKAIQPRILDVGARGGPLPRLNVLAPFSHLFLCEPDIVEAERIGEKLRRKNFWQSVTMIPEALAEKQGSVILHMTEKAGLSSLFEPNPSFVRTYCVPCGAPEVPWLVSARRWEVVDRIKVPAITLDEAAEKYGIDGITFLKLDTQGTELAILQGGVKRVLPSVLAILVEMEFVSVYRQQPLFSEVHMFLENHGFRVMGFRNAELRRFTNIRIPYSQGEVGWTHALYFRERKEDGTALRASEITGLIPYAIAFEYFDYALWYLDDPYVQAYLNERGWKGIAEEVASYAKEYGIVRGR